MLDDYDHILAANCAIGTTNWAMLCRWDGSPSLDPSPASRCPFSSFCWCPKFLGQGWPQGPTSFIGLYGWLVQGDLEDWHVFKGFQRDSRGYRNRWNRLRNDRCHMISPRRFQVVTRHGGQPRQLRSYLSRVFWHKTHDASGFNSILGGNPRKKHFMSLSWTLGYPQNSPECCRVASLTHGILRFQILRHGQVLMPFSWDMMYWVRAQGSQGSQVALPP